MSQFSVERTLFHVTHWKAGSQWIHRILRELCPHAIVDPELWERQFLEKPIQPRRVYPTVYVTREQFHSVALPGGSHRFVVIRDLRDTLVSAYFSIKISHPMNSDVLARLRAELNGRDLESGLLFLIEHWLPASAAIQASWVNSGEPLIRYEDLLSDDVALLESALLHSGALRGPRDVFEQLVRSMRFEALTGRPRGTEVVTAHERKGVAGDWRNYFTARVRREFDRLYGGLLRSSGYSWPAGEPA